MTTAKKDTANESADDQIQAREQAEQLKDLQKKLAAAEAKAQESEQAKAEAEAKAQAAEQAKAEAEQKAARVDELESQLEAAQASKGAEAKQAVEPQILAVISNTDYCYMLEGGVRVTPDAPIRAEWKPGNLLDCNMKAGLIVKYEV